MTSYNLSPVRTCNNFNINDINLDIEKDVLKKSIFNGIHIVNESKENTISYDVDENISFKYGLNSDLNKNIFSLSNSKLKIDVNSKKTDDMVIDFKLSKDEDYLKNLTEVCLSENSKLNLVIKFESIDGAKESLTSYIKFNLKKNAYLNVVIINLLNDKSLNLLALDSSLYENANLDVTLIDLGARSAVINYYSSLEGKGSRNDLKSIYIGNKDKMIDLNYIMSLKNANSSVNMDVKGALLDNSKKHFKGTISFEKGSKKSVGKEMEYTYLLSEGANSISLPMLLCREEDVEGEHASASGKLDKNILFYLMSRGMSEKDATRLIIKAKFNDILSKIKDETLVNSLLEKIDEKLT